MDKNTIKMMVMMAVVIFGFMLLNKPVKRDNAESAKASATEDTTLVIDSIHSDESAIIYAADYLRQAGVKSTNAAGTTIYTYNSDNTQLVLDGNVVSGVVAVDDFEMSYDDVVNSRFPEAMTVEQKAAAASTLRNALNDASRYKTFAQYRQAPSDIDSEEDLTLENSVIRLTFSRKGGMIDRAVLKDYFTYFPSASDKEKVDTLPVVMFDSRDAAYSFTLRTSEQNIETSEFYFTPEIVNDSTMLMSLDLGGGAMWGLRYTLPADSYVAHIDVVQRKASSVIPASMDAIGFKWNMTMPRQERGRTFEERNSQVEYQYPGENPDNINGMKDGSATLENSANWIAFKNQFFSNVIIANHNPFQRGGTMTQKKLNDEFYVKQMGADMTVAYNVQAEVPAQFDFYIGPNLYPLLNKVDDQLQIDDQSLKLNRLVPLGWSWLRWINTLIVIPVFNFLSGFNLNYGIIILLLTIFIKVILFPLTYKSLKSQAKMRVLAPEIKEINEKYPGQENAMTRQQKTMALYSSAGASPFAGCLPMLLQMPILIAMFSFFPSAIELRGQSFLWAQNLAAPDVVLTLPFKIPFYGDHVSLFCLLMTMVNIVYTRINMQNQPSQQGMPGMKWVMYLMPLMFLFFFNDYAAALSYYYFLSLLITITLTYVFRHFTDEKKLRKQMMERAANAKPKKSGFMARLAEAQRRQQEELRKQQQQRGGRR